MKFYATISKGEVRPYMPALPVLCVASSWLPTLPKLPPQITEKAADSGGFVATFKWGNYRYSPSQYVKWLDGWLPQWAATFDYCCENEITSGRPGVVRERQQKTTEMASHFWMQYRDKPWCWVPTVQGWEALDYQRHALELKPLIDEMQSYYGPDSFFRVGIGTLCRRASVAMIHEVVSVVSQILPDIPLHLWGVKLDLLQSEIALPAGIASMDSAAWNGLWGTGREKWKHSGLSQRRYSLQVALPSYLKKVEIALATPKQAVLLFERKSHDRTF